ncbi:PBP1A family penicillin-binding protein [Paenalkalicoccus suaedae]|uniref:PBP1A family penicillin-binding protein n=2 Tax=Paenalkalicoccus suaedae TaxID=2592382 RepID=A0A859FK69_9BACI|nr:PBP1A family penicillin-binding protein [Paenalkalicoccus suaedae]QKS73198.1 PBP1A family penicillin-binding protein [Paenalkalicoccus suaedae]
MMKKITFSIIFILLVSIAGVTTYLGIILFGNYAIDETDLIMKESTTITDTDGQEITRLFTENREVVGIDEIPTHVREAFIAVEDQRFMQHTGIDFRSIGRALYRDIMTQSAAEGGSTITQQLAKNVFLSPEKSILRKTEEVLIAINLEHRYSKEEILEMYLNRIYFGHGAHGIQAASKLYFDKDVSELAVEEGALLAALPKGPNLYSPFIDAENSKQRRDVVLRLMQQQEYITAEETVALQGRTIPTEQHSIVANPAHLTYVDLVIDEAVDTYGISETAILEGGYEIVVAMNQEMQESSYNQFQQAATFPEAPESNPVQGSFVLLDNETGGVTAVQGGRDYVRKGFNRVTALRQPGSTFKPIAVYAPALESGNYHPYSLLSDEEQAFGDYTPTNLSGSYSGEMSMYDALRDSINMPSVWLLDQIGVDYAKRFLALQQMNLDESGLGIALGGLTDGVSPMQIAAAYRTFANDGLYSEPYFIEAIYDRDGELVAQVDREEVQVMSEQTAWYMTRMLESVVTEGTGQAGSFDGALAGKTGTSQGTRDIWFAGFTPEESGVVWMGQDRTIEGEEITMSSSSAVQAFKSILSSDSDRLMAFERPEGITDLEDPIRFVAISDLEADMSPGLFGGTIDLRWSESDDDRLHYRIYKVENGDRSFVDEVVGDGSYTISRVNFFSSSTYVVVPFDPLTNREGDASNLAEASWQLFSSR